MSTKTENILNNTKNTFEKFEARRSSANTQRYAKYAVFLIIFYFIFKKGVGMLFAKYGYSDTDEMSSTQQFLMKNRCNPIAMPFVRLFNGGEVSTGQNFTECMESMISSFFGEYIRMFSSNQNKLFATISRMGGDISNMKKVIDNLRQSLIDILSDVYARLQNAFKRINKLLVSFKNLISYLMNLFLDLFGVLKFTYFTLQSLERGPIGKVGRFFGCFQKDTRIQLSTTNKNNLFTKPIIEIQIGDKLKGGGIVTAIMKFKVTSQIMYNYKNIIVSDSHMIFYKNKWIYVKDIPNIKIVENFKDEYIYCLNTSNNLIYINNEKFSDYEECVNNTLQRSLMRYSLFHLNQTEKTFKNDKKIISIDIQCFTENSIKKYLSNPKNLLGIIKIDGSTIKKLYKLGDIISSGSVFVFDKKDSMWKQMIECGKEIENAEKYLYNIITTDNLIKFDMDYYTRDYYVSSSKIYNKIIGKMIPDWMNEN